MFKDADDWKELIGVKGAKKRTSSFQRFCSSQAHLDVFSRRENM